MDRRTWAEVVEYLVAVLLAILMALLLAEHFTTPLWGGLSGVHLQ
jgi:hypothetical protein